MTDHGKYASSKTGRIITHNRWHIKPTPISAEHYLCSQLNKHTKTDPIHTILGHLDKHPPPSTIADTTTERTHNHCTANDWTAPGNAQNDNKNQTEKKHTNVKAKNKDSNNKEDVISTRYGWIGRKPDRLNY